MIDKKINVTTLLQALKASGQHELVQKLQDRAVKSGIFWDEDECVLEAGDLIQTLSDYGQRDLVRNLKKSMEESEIEEGKIERLELIFRGGHRTLERTAMRTTLRKHGRNTMPRRS